MDWLKLWHYGDLGRPPRSDWHEPLDEGDVHLWCLDAADVGDLVDYHCCLLDSGELDRLAWLRTAETQYEFIASHGAFRHLLGYYTRTSPTHIRLGSTKHGKPYLASPAGGSLHFNMAHSGGRIVCAFSRCEVGVDVEALAPDIVSPELIEAVFTPADMQTLASLSREHGELRAFFAMWTLKESYIKATGLGFSADLQSFAVHPHPDSRSHVIHSLRSGEQRQWRLYTVDLGEDHACALATANRDR